MAFFLEELLKHIFFKFKYIFLVYAPQLSSQLNFLFHTCECSVCIYVCATYMCLVPMKEKGAHWIPWNWSNGWLWTAKNVLRTSLHKVLLTLSRLSSLRTTFFIICLCSTYLLWYLYNTATHVCVHACTQIYIYTHTWIDRWICRYMGNIWIMLICNLDT